LIILNLEARIKSPLNKTKYPDSIKPDSIDYSTQKGLIQIFYTFIKYRFKTLNSTNQMILDLYNIYFRNNMLGLF